MIVEPTFELESSVERTAIAPFAPVIGSAIRPYEEQTTLERVLRSHLWYPNNILDRGAKALPKCVKAKEYRQAADWQELMRKAASDKKDLEYLLELYEQERQSPNAPDQRPPATDV